MSLNTYVFLGIVIVNVFAGLYSSRGIKNIREYAVGNRNFSTVALVCTIVATWLSGDDFFIFVSESYANGLYFISACVLGGVILFLLVGMFFVPRMSEFLGNLSIAEAMGSIYGNNIRSIVAIAGCIGTAGVIAAQLKVAGLLFEYSLNIPKVYGIVTAGIVVTMYATFGGIKSVTFTDIIQLFTFGTVIPVIAFFILETLPDSNSFFVNLATNDLFNYKEVFNLNNPKSLYYLFLFFYVIIPSFDPTIFQRISMASSIWQARKSFIISAFVMLALNALMSWVGIVVLTAYPNIDPDNVVKHVVMNYSYIGFSGLALAGVMAMVMSTTDSYINSSAILIIHDFCKSIGIKIKNELNASRITSFCLGILGILLALKSENLLKLIITTRSFYMPIVTVPFIFAVLGFRSTAKSVLIGMIAGFTTVVFWELFLRNDFIDSIVPGMIANICFFLGSHYLLNQAGGWVGIKDNSPILILRRRRRKMLKEFINSFYKFNIKIFLKQNTPKQEVIYIYLGLFCVTSVYTTMHCIPDNLKFSNRKILDFIYPSVFFISTLLISYPLWTKFLKTTLIMPIIWNITLIYILVCISFMQVLVSNLGQMQLMIFLLSIIVLSILTRWKISLFFITIGIFITSQFLNLYTEINYFNNNDTNLQFKIIYSLLLVSTVLLTFFKPQQERQELSDKKVGHLELHAKYRQEELQKAYELKHEFLRNLDHEAHTPITGITSLGETLYEHYDHLNDEQRKGYLKDISNSSTRLNSYVNNMINTSKLSSMNYSFNKETLDFGELVEERLDICKKLYLDEKYEDFQEFIINIEDNVTSFLDKYYISQAIDNIIINAIQYCKKGKITINVIDNEKTIELIVIDEGIGIDKKDIYNIFGSFTVSSKTKTPAGGRGVGLALCKKIIELHKGTIEAKINKLKGITIKIVLPKFYFELNV
jgi:Na+/proline symporter/signal transduction histidine kinase